MLKMNWHWHSFIFGCAWIRCKICAVCVCGFNLEASIQLKSFVWVFSHVNRTQKRKERNKSGVFRVLKIGWTIVSWIFIQQKRARTYNWIITMFRHGRRNKNLRQPTIYPLPIKHPLHIKRLLVLTSLFRFNLFIPIPKSTNFND